MKYTPETEAKICEALKAGNTRKASAEYAGISEVTFYEWIKDPERLSFTSTEEMSLSFLSAIKKAESDAEVYACAVIKKAMPDNWTAAAWWLERRKPHDYGRNLTIRADREAESLISSLLGEDADGDTAEAEGSESL